MPTFEVKGISVLLRFNPDLVGDSQKINNDVRLRTGFMQICSY